MVAFTGLVVFAFPIPGERALGRYLEEEYGLGLRFWSRGPIAAPSEVVVVTPDQASQEALDLKSPNLLEWNRKTHAELIDALVDRNASVIVLDIYFRNPKETEGDEALVDAVRRSGRTVVGQYIRKADDRDGPKIWTINPMEGLVGAARALAAADITPPDPRTHAYAQFFRIHADIDSARVCQAVHPGKTAPGHYDWPEVPSIPVATLQLAVLQTMGYENFISPFAGLLEDLPSTADDAAGLCGMMSAMRRALRNRSAVSEKVLEAMQDGPKLDDDSQRENFTRLINVYSSEDGEETHINFYGGAGRIKTYAYKDFVGASGAGNEDDLRGKVVFIGLSDAASASRIDEYPTHYGTLSGVEIVATAFANLLQDRSLRFVSTPGYVLATAGFLFAALAFAAPLGVSTAVVLGSGFVYFLATQSQFNSAGLLIPLAVPLFVQLPLALGGAFLWNYTQKRREARKAERAKQEEERKRRRAEKTTRLYVPESASLDVDEAGLPSTEQTRFYGTCLVTDVAGFTTLAEHKDPAELARINNDYFDMLSNIVKASGGERTHIHGDSTTNVWRVDQETAAGRLRPCLAAIETQRAVEQFNRRHPDAPLITRCGLSSGALAWGNIGGGGHFVVGVTGDTVHTASRLEQLNKQLGTKLLASRSVVEGLDGVLIRCLGDFELRGKNVPVTVYEIIAHRDRATAAQKELCAHFENALIQFNAKNWREAARLFDQILASCKDDGPSKYYSRRLREHSRTGTGNFNKGLPVD